MQNSIEYFDNYLENKLSPLDKTLFEARLNTDDTFAEDFTMHQALREQLRRIYLKERILAATAHQPLPEANPYKKVWQICIGILLMLGFIVGIYKALNSNEIEVKEKTPIMEDSSVNQAQANLLSTPTKVESPNLPQLSQPKSTPKRHPKPSTIVLQSSNDSLVIVKHSTIVLQSSNDSLVIIKHSTVPSKDVISPINAMDSWQLQKIAETNEVAMNEVQQNPPPNFTHWERAYANGEVLKSSENNSGDSKSDYFYAYYLLRSGNPKQALPLFERLANKSFSEYQSAEWYLALCQILLGKSPIIIKPLLAQIIDNPEHAYYEKAIQLKKRLQLE